MDQELPFHISMSAWACPAVVYPPTAMQNVGLVHDTAVSLWSWAGEVLALGTIDHAETDAAGAGAETARTPAPAQIMAMTTGRMHRPGVRQLDHCRV